MYIIIHILAITFGGGLTGINNFLLLQIKLYYYDELANILHQDDKANLPVLDPTQGK